MRAEQRCRNAHEQGLPGADSIVRKRGVAARDVAAARELNRVPQRLRRQPGAVELEKNRTDVALVDTDARAVDRMRNRRRQTVVMFECPGGRMLVHRNDRGGRVQQERKQRQVRSQRNHLLCVSTPLYRGISRGQSLCNKSRSRFLTRLARYHRISSGTRYPSVISSMVFTGWSPRRNTSTKSR